MKRKGTNKLKSIILEKIFHLYFEKGLKFETLWLQRNEYKDFWSTFCSITGKFTFEDLSDHGVKELAHKIFMRKTRSAYTSPVLRARLDELKLKREAGENLLEPVNQILVTDTKEEVVFNDDGSELVRTKTQEVRKMKIERIEFASPTTVDAVNIANQTQKATSEFFEDLMLKVQGKQTKKHQFIHLDMAAKVKELALDILDGMEALLDGSDAEEAAAVQKKMSQVMRFAKVADTVKKMEMQPLYTMNLIHETGANRQKELTGAITNDRMMIDYGNVKIAQDEKVVTDTARVRNAIKEKGYIAIDELLIQNLQNIGAYSEEQTKEIENSEEIIADEEFEDINEELTK